MEQVVITEQEIKLLLNDEVKSVCIKTDKDREIEIKKVN